MAQMNMLQAINNALDIAMSEDDSTLCFGEDVGILAVYFVQPRVCKINMARHAVLIRHWLSKVLSGLLMG